MSCIEVLHRYAPSKRAVKRPQDSKEDTKLGLHFLLNEKEMMAIGFELFEGELSSLKTALNDLPQRLVQSSVSFTLEH